MKLKKMPKGKPKKTTEDIRKDYEAGLLHDRLKIQGNQLVEARKEIDKLKQIIYDLEKDKERLEQNVELMKFGS